MKTKEPLEYLQPPFTLTTMNVCGGVNKVLDANGTIVAEWEIVQILNAQALARSLDGKVLVYKESPNG